MRNNNPIFIEYYPHEKSDCYKIKNPWTRYVGDIIVLCPVKDGLKRAKELAITALNKQLLDALNQPLTPDE